MYLYLSSTRGGFGPTNKNVFPPGLLNACCLAWQLAKAAGVVNDNLAKARVPVPSEQAGMVD
jgi:hypothetical protein